MFGCTGSATSFGGGVAADALVAIAGIPDTLDNENLVLDEAGFQPVLLITG